MLAPTQKDFELTRSAFERHDIRVAACDSLDDLVAQLPDGAGAALVAEEALSNPQAFTHWIERQEAWSDLPILVLARPDADSVALTSASERLGNVTILVRPVRMAALISAVQAALRARRRQYQIRQHLVERANAEEQLRLNDQRKDEFLAILAHELRNPLAPVSNALHILRPWLADHQHALGVLQMMERQVGNLTRLVDDLLEVSRVTRGDLDLHPQRCDLLVLLRTAVESSQPLINAARHRLTVEMPAAPIYLVADPVRLSQVISNLLNNAAKYTPHGGQIALNARTRGSEVEIEVQDDGMGIPVTEQERIFELFMQVDRNRNRSQGGLGIGLTLVKRLVELHGGSISVFSEGSGKGSRFTVRLPLLKAEGAAIDTDSPPSSCGLSAVSVVIADDNRDAADTLGVLLEQFGAKVTVTYGGQEALQALGGGGVDIAILDLGMPDMDGLEVARRIRAQKDHDAVLLLALTGWGQQEDMRATRKAGFDHHFTKPVDFAQLIGHLDRVVRQRPAGLMR